MNTIVREMEQISLHTCFWQFLMSTRGRSDPHDWIFQLVESRSYAKRSSVAPCGLWNRTLTWIASRRFCLKPFGWEHSCFSVCWGINLWQMNVFWSLYKEALQYYALIGLSGFWSQMNTTEQPATNRNRSRPWKSRVARLHFVYLGRYLRSCVFINSHI